MKHKLTVLTIILGAIFTSCSKETYETEFNIKDYTLSTPGGKTVGQGLSIRDGKMPVCVPRGTDLTSLRASYLTGAETVTVNGVTQESGKTENDFSKAVKYTLKFKSGKVFSFTVTVIPSDLPVIIASTPYPKVIAGRDAWVEDCSIYLWNTDGSITAVKKAKMRYRGNATMRFPKKAFAVKFEEKQELLGMPADKRWDLLANWRDVTEIRNEVGLEIARCCTGLKWTPRARFVELIYNGEHQGLYYLTEHIKIADDRVNITKMKTTDNAGDLVTGGYLLELDSYFDEVKQFKSNKKSMPYIVKEPSEDDITEYQFNFIQNYVNKAEEVLYSDDWKKSYQSYFDVDSFIDYWFVYELSESTEGGAPHSFHLYKDRGGKLTAGPVWDFDFPTFYPDKTSFVAKSCIYYGQFFKDSAFKKRVKEKWKEEKPAFEKIPEHIDKIAPQIDFSAERDYLMWPIIPDLARVYNGDEFYSHDYAVELLRKSYIQRLEWLDKAIEAL